jgi:hypothetical protein
VASTWKYCNIVILLTVLRNEVVRGVKRGKGCGGKYSYLQAVLNTLTGVSAIQNPLVLKFLSLL